MSHTSRACLALCFLLCAAPGLADPATESAVCLECHDYGEDSPMHAVLDGSHGLSGDAE